MNKEHREKLSAAKARHYLRKWDGKLSVDVVRALYSQGMKQREVAAALGVSQKVIWRFMRKNKIAARPRGHRDQHREKGNAWKGDQAGYKSFHERVSKQRGTPKQCEACGTTDPAKRYEWANQTGVYHDVNDYVRMCAKCHRNFDAARRRGA